MLPRSRILVTGNTVVEATLESLPDASTRSRLLEQYGVRPDGYVLATIHRPENTDDPERLRSILAGLAALDVPVVLPLHPRTAGRVEAFGLGGLLTDLRVVEPVDHPTFLGLAQHARLLISDSGGVQEECTVLKRPLLVLRNSTERPEAIEAGFARRVVPGPGLAVLLRDTAADDDWLPSLAAESSPYGDGAASAHIVRAVEAILSPRPKEEPR